MHKITPIILCGGSGSRLWPTSRADRPKQFAQLTKNSTPFEQTLERVSNSSIDESHLAALRFDEPIIVGGKQFGQLILDCAQAAGETLSDVILEPFGMDSAPALAASLVTLAKQDPSTIAIMMPSDHLISPIADFHQCLINGCRAIDQNGWVVTFGITPTSPETQFGYIERTDVQADSNTAHPIANFHEKPDLQRAESYLATGRFFWNSGMFMFRVSDMVEAFKAQAPQTWAAVVQAVEQGDRDGKILHLNETEFAKAEAKSIDYAVMEPLSAPGQDKLGVVPTDFAWNDLGTWNQIYEVESKDESTKNSLRGDVIALQTTGSLISSSGRLIAVAGLSDVVIVDEEDTLLVMDRNQTALTKDIYAELNKRGKPEIALPVRSTDFDARKASDWLMQVAIPFWLKHGVDVEQGGVYEHLHFDGSPVSDDHKRFRVLPRQIYSFSEALIEARARKLETAGQLEDQIRKLLDHMVATGHAPSGGWIHRYKPDGSVQNPTCDAYDHCFVLLAMASLHRATGWVEATKIAEETLAYLDNHLADSAGGYAENDKFTLPRRANPHMHFFEAMMAWHEATGDAQYLDRAQAIADLFTDRFFDNEHGVLRELFAQDWTVQHSNGGEFVEPGHHYEWIWLLLRFNKLRPNASITSAVLKLYGHARTYGHSLSTFAVKQAVPADPLGPDAIGMDGERCRCWPQTEALKASVELRAIGVQGAEDLGKKMLATLFEHYLVHSGNKGQIAGSAKPGVWVDAIDANGAPLTEIVPSSTLYHILCAIKVLAEDEGVWGSSSE